MEAQALTALQVFGRSVTDPSFWVGAGSVVLFAHNRFRMQSSPSDALDPPVHARSFTTRFRYGIAEFAYALFYWAIFVVLVSFGSLEEFRAWLEILVGEISLDADVVVASPAWAALVASAVLPSVPGFKAADEAIRTFLHDVSSIPVKAHHLAKDILEAAAAENRSAMQSFNLLWAVVDQFPERERPATARLYKKFRSDNRDFLEDVKKRVVKAGCFKEQAEEDEYFRELLARLSRFLSCALLSSEPDELTAREHLNRLPTNLRLEVPRVGWQFRLQQILLSVLLVTVLTLIGGLTANLVVWLLRRLGYGFLGPIQWDAHFLATLVQWTLYAVPMFMLPLIFSAGIKLYLVDRLRYRTELEGDRIPLDDYVLALAIAFVGSYFLAGVPILMGLSAHIGKAMPPDAVGAAVGNSLVWGLPPAVFSVVFILRSSVRPTRGSWGCGMADFLTHAIPVWAVTTLLAWVYGSGKQDIQGIASHQWILMVSTVGLLIAGFLGALNCHISRSRSRCRWRGGRTAWRNSPRSRKGRSGSSGRFFGPPCEPAVGAGGRCVPSPSWDGGPSSQQER